MGVKEVEYILCNPNFMNWIMRKLSNHYYIDDGNASISREEQADASKIKYLYQIVFEYAMNNGFQATKFGQNDAYYINYKGNIFFVYAGNGSYGCFKNTLDKKEIPYCINFEDIRREKIDELLNFESSSFSDLNDEIRRLYNKGVSLDFISEIVNKIIYNIKIEEKGHTYKKI